MTKPNEEAILAAKLTLLVLQSQKVRDKQFSPLEHATHAAKLKSMARAIHRLDEARCNRELTEREEKRVISLRKAIVGLAKEYGITRVEFNQDPRGYAVYLHFPDGRGNTWGGDGGWGI